MTTLESAEVMLGSTGLSSPGPLEVVSRRDGHDSEGQAMTRGRHSSFLEVVGGDRVAAAIVGECSVVRPFGGTGVGAAAARCTLFYLFHSPSR